MVTVTAEGAKEYLKMLFKNGTAEMIYFFAGLLILSEVNPDLLEYSILRLLIKIGIYLSFSGICIRLCLGLGRHTILYVGETIDRYKKKDWILEPTPAEKALEMAEKTFTPKPEEEPTLPTPIIEKIE